VVALLFRWRHCLSGDGVFVVVVALLLWLPGYNVSIDFLQTLFWSSVGNLVFQPATNGSSICFLVEALFLWWCNCFCGGIAPLVVVLFILL
jgi:hypothetical protein